MIVGGRGVSSTFLLCLRRRRFPTPTLVNVFRLSHHPSWSLGVVWVLKRLPHPRARPEGIRFRTRDLSLVSTPGVGVVHGDCGTEDPWTGSSVSRVGGSLPARRTRVSPGSGDVGVGPAYHTPVRTSVETFLGPGDTRPPHHRPENKTKEPGSTRMGGKWKRKKFHEGSKGLGSAPGTSGR